MARIPLDLPIRVPTSVGDDATFGPDHRVTCTECVGRSGTWCQPRAMPHVPLTVKHDCAHFRGRRVA